MQDQTPTTSSQTADIESGFEPTQDLNVVATTSLVSPRDLAQQLPMTLRSNTTVVQSRRIIQDILEGRDNRFLVLVGPYSIHDDQAAMD